MALVRLRMKNCLEVLLVNHRLIVYFRGDEHAAREHFGEISTFELSFPI